MDSSKLLLLFPLLISSIFAADKNYDLPECSKKMGRVVMEEDGRKGIITGLTIANGTDEKCTIAFQLMGSTITLMLEELNFDCSSGQLNVTLLGGVGADAKNLCSIPSRKGLIGTTNSMFLLNVLLTPRSTTDKIVFKLKLRYFTCGGRVNSDFDKKGSFEAPALPAFSAGYKCTLALKPSTYLGGYPIVTVASLDLEFGHNCSGDRIEFSMKGKEKVRICDAKQTDLRLTSSEMDITFIVAKGSSKQRRFKINYEYCNYKKNIEAGSSGIQVTSPGYPQPALAGTKCTWFFIVPKENVLYAKFEELVLQPEVNCSASRIEFLGYDRGKQCSTPKRVVSFIERNASPAFSLITGPNSTSVKFKMLGSFLKRNPVTSLRLYESNATKTILSSPAFPGPSPQKFERIWYVDSKGLVPVYLDALNFTADSCERATLVVRRMPLSEDWPRTLKLCSNTDKKVLGYLGTGYSFRIKLLTKDTPLTVFRLRFEHSKGRWTKWRRGECSVDCGYGLQRFDRSCENSTSRGCFSTEKKAWIQKDSKTEKCWRLSCEWVRREESWYSVRFELRFSEHVSKKLFFSAVGPAIQNVTAARLTAFCNENGARCCQKTGSWKRPDPSRTYAFIEPSGIRFARDTPNIRTLLLKVSFFAVPPAQSELCTKLVAARRRRAAEETPATTKPPEPTEGALPKDVLLAAMKELKDEEIVAAVMEALRKDGMDVVASVVSEMAPVKSRGSPPRKDEDDSTPNYYLIIGIPLMCILILKFIYLCFRFCCRNRQRGNQEEAAAAEIPLKTENEEANA